MMWRKLLNSRVRRKDRALRRMSLVKRAEGVRANRAELRAVFLDRVVRLTPEMDLQRLLVRSQQFAEAAQDRAADWQALAERLDAELKEAKARVRELEALLAHPYRDISEARVELVALLIWRWAGALEEGGNGV